MLVEEDAFSYYYLLVNGTFAVADDVRDIWAIIQKRCCGCWVGVKDLMFFVDELPNLVDLMEDYETNFHFSMHDAREELLQAWEDSYEYDTTE